MSSSFNFSSFTLPSGQLATSNVDAVHKKLSSQLAKEQESGSNTDDLKLRILAVENAVPMIASLSLTEMTKGFPLRMESTATFFCSPDGTTFYMTRSERFDKKRGAMCSEVATITGKVMTDFHNGKGLVDISDDNSVTLLEGGGFTRTPYEKNTNEALLTSALRECAEELTGETDQDTVLNFQQSSVGKEIESAYKKATVAFLVSDRVAKVGKNEVKVSMNTIITVFFVPVDESLIVSINQYIANNEKREHRNFFSARVVNDGKTLTFDNSTPNWPVIYGAKAEVRTFIKTLMKFYPAEFISALSLLKQ